MAGPVAASGAPGASVAAPVAAAAAPWATEDAPVARAPAPPARSPLAARSVRAPSDARAKPSRAEPRPTSTLATACWLTVEETAVCTCDIASRPSVDARNELASLYVTISSAAVGSAPPADAIFEEKSVGIVRAK
ncbi:hypothetical protein GALL_390570 [mine drainage metagenome]|uniref:Uncharacterized protein n=1 Tax=mine drainage metagenome TaxID=410659 RepID=A0A1J5Q683_9ZZZZ